MADTPLPPPSAPEPPAPLPAPVPEPVAPPAPKEPLLDRLFHWPHLDARIEAWWEANNTYVYIAGFLCLFLVVFFATRIFIPINAGESGVLFRRFFGGTVMDRTYGEGMAIIPPWNTMTIYNMRLQTVDDHFEVLASDGLRLTVNMSIRYRPVPENLPTLHKEVGPEYFDKIVRPGVESVVRIILGQYKPEEIYTSKKFVIQNAVQGALNEVGERYVQLDDLLITSIDLPDTVRDAVEQKLKQQQISEEFAFRVDRETKEAERKRIEAEGIRDFQNIISRGLTDNFLRFKGIEATLELAKSPNAKVLIFGGKDGLPVILDATSRGDNGGTAAPASAPDVTGPLPNLPEPASSLRPKKTVKNNTLGTSTEAAGVVPPPPVSSPIPPADAPARP